MTREDYIKKAYEEDNTLDPSSLARGWSLKEKSLRDQEKINFDLTRVRKWKRKDNGKIMKVMPWYQPIAEESRLDFQGILRDVMPELDIGETLGSSHIYSGLLMQQGYMVENHNRVWFGMFLTKEQAAKVFDDCGFWDNDKDEHDELFKPDEDSV
jgi:hypothetical protein